MFARAADARKISVLVEHVDDQLQVEVRRPASVHRRVTNCGKRLACGNRLPRRQVADGLPRQVTVQRKKDIAGVGLVPKDDHRTVIERRPILGNRMDTARDGRVHRCSGRRKQIHAKVNRPTLSVLTLTGKQRRRIHAPRFEVPADSNVRAGIVHLSLDATCQLRFGLGAGVADHERAGHTQVDDDCPGLTVDHVGVHLCPLQPRGHTIAPGYRRDPACAAEDRLGKPRMNLRQARKRPTDGRLADGQIWIVWPIPLLMGSHARAHAQAETDEIEQLRDLGILQWMRGVVSAHDVGGPKKRISRLEDDIRHCNREIRDRVAVNQVAEVDDASDKGAT